MGRVSFNTNIHTHTHTHTHTVQGNSPHSCLEDPGHGLPHPPGCPPPVGVFTLVTRRQNFDVRVKKPVIGLDWYFDALHWASCWLLTRASKILTPLNRASSMWKPLLAHPHLPQPILEGYSPHSSVEDPGCHPQPSSAVAAGSLHSRLHRTPPSSSDVAWDSEFSWREPLQEIDHFSGTVGVEAGQRKCHSLTLFHEIVKRNVICDAWKILCQTFMEKSITKNTSNNFFQHFSCERVALSPSPVFSSSLLWSSSFPGLLSLHHHPVLCDLSWSVFSQYHMGHSLSFLFLTHIHLSILLPKVCYIVGSLCCQPVCTCVTFVISGQQTIPSGQGIKTGIYLCCWSRLMVKGECGTKTTEQSCVCVCVCVCVCMCVMQPSTHMSAARAQWVETQSDRHR